MKQRSSSEHPNDLVSKAVQSDDNPAALIVLDFLHWCEASHV